MGDVLVAVYAGIADAVQVADVILLWYGIPGDICVRQRALDHVLLWAYSITDCFSQNAR